MKKFKLLSVHVILPILIGGLMYISFRSSSLRLFNWFDNLGVHNFVYWLRSMTTPFKSSIPSWTYFSLPDGLWIYSFTSALIIYWNKDSRQMKFWLFIPFASGILIEILQGLKLFPGTFDYLDLTFSIFGLLLSIQILTHKIIDNDKQVF